MSDLYRVVKQHYYNNGILEPQRVEVLYCGYDRDEARRVYHEHEPMEVHASPGAYGWQLRVRRLREKKPS